MQYRLTELLLTCRAHAPCWIEVKSILTDFPLATDARAERTIVDTVKCATQLIKPWITLERQDGINLVHRELAVNKGFPRPFDIVILLQVRVQCAKNGMAHCPFTLLHSHLLTLKSHYRPTAPSAPKDGECANVSERVPVINYKTSDKSQDDFTKISTI